MIKPIDQIQWFHSHDFGSGVVTKGSKDPGTLAKEAELIFRYPVAGKSVLDVGAWDGFFSFESERRGAARVLATDHFCWSGEGWGTRDGFDTAHDHFGSRVETLDIDAMDIGPESVGEFDVVLYLGVLYHLRHPFLGLEKVASVTREWLVVETLLDLYTLDRPAGAFYPGTEKHGDPTNWWGLNEPAIRGMLDVLGFKRVEFRPHPYSDPNVPDSMRGIFHAFRD